MYQVERAQINQPFWPLHLKQCVGRMQQRSVRARPAHCVGLPRGTGPDSDVCLRLFVPAPARAGSPASDSQRDIVAGDAERALLPVSEALWSRQ